MAHVESSVNGFAGYDIPPHLIGEVARKLRGDPTKATKNELRFGAHGSLSVDLTKGTFFDHESKEGGGILTLIERETGAKDGERWEKLEEITGFKREPKPKTAKKARPREVCAYNYVDADGALRYQAVRYEPKAFKQRRPDPDKLGKWLWNMKGVEPLPYRLPQTMKAIERGDTIVIVEGEKDADNLARLGIEATTNHGGANKWWPQLTPYFRGAKVVLMGDNHQTGLDHINSVGAALTGTAASIRHVDIPKWWPECPDKGDVSKWVEAGATFEDILAAVEEAPAWEPPKEPAEGDAEERQGDFVLVRRQVGKRGPGVYFIEEEDKDGVRPWRRVCSLLEPLADSRDSESMNWGCQLEVIDGDGKRHVWVMPNEMGPTVGDGTDFRRELVRRGLKIASGSKARNRLSDYVTMWKPRRKVRCVPTVGWHGDAFVMPDRAYGGAEDVVMQTAGAAPDFATAGTLEGWRDDIAAKCVGNSRLIFSTSAAFAGPLLKLTGEESGGVHFRGASSIGKTTALHVARSVWGTQLGSWRTTDNSAEAIASGACDALLTLDEIGQAHPRVVGELAYMLGNGRGKGRMKRDATARQVHRWRVLFLSTGEIGMAARVAEGGDKARAGQEVRVLELQAGAGKGLGLFEQLHDFGSAAQLAEHLRLAADRNCGHAARVFLEHITTNKGELASVIVAARSTFITENCPEGANGQVRRACGRFAIVAIAGELATQAGITGWREGEAREAAVRLFEDWLEERGGAGAAETREAFEQVRLFLEQHGEARFSAAWDRAVTEVNISDRGEVFEVSKTDRPTINRAGFRKVSNEGTTFYVLPEVWRREVCKGLDAKAVAAAMAERGWLLKEPGRQTRSERIPGQGNQRVYVIPPAFLSWSDEK